jgi:zinc protease
MNALRRWLAALALVLLSASPVEAAPSLERRLDNGLHVVVFTDRRFPIVQVQVLVAAGSRHEQPFEGGAARLTAVLLTRGTTSRSGDQYAKEVDALGATVAGDATRDFATLTGTFRSADLARGLDLMSDAVMNPLLEDAAIRATRRQVVGNWIESRDHPDAIADEHVWGVALAGHPYARPDRGAMEELAGLNSARLVAFHRGCYRPDHAWVAIAGDVDPAQALAAVQEAFGGWSGKSRPGGEPIAPPAIGMPRIRIVDLPGATEAAIRIGSVVPPDDADNPYAITVVNDLLGGGPGSRLAPESGRVLRSYSDLQLYGDAGLMVLGTSARTDSVLRAIDRLRDEMRRFGSSPPSEAEVQRARHAIARSYPIRNESIAAQSAQWLGAAARGFSTDYADRYSERMEAVTADSVRAAARRVLDPDRVAIVVVGDASALEPQLQGLGTIEVVPVGSEPGPVALRPAMRMDEPDSASIRRGRQLVQQAVAAHGGLTRLKGIKDSRVKGEITFYQGDQSVTGSHTELRREPNRLRVETEFPQGMTVQAVSGDTAWTRVSAGERDSVVDEGPDAAEALRHEFAGDLQHLLVKAADPKSRVAWRGQEPVGETMTDVVELIDPAGTRWVLFLEGNKHRLIAAEENQGSLLRGAVMRRTFGDLRTVQGLAWPHYEERWLNGERALAVKVSSVQLNTGLTAEPFRRPGASVAKHPRR